MTLTLIDLETALFADGTPHDDTSIMLAHCVLELLVDAHGHDTILAMLIELADMERQCSQPDED